MDRHFLERMNAQDLHSSVQSAGQLQLLVQDGNDQVDAHRNPYLALHRIDAVAVEVLDAQVLFDPAKEELDLPAQFVESGHAQRGHLQVVGQKDQVAAGFLVEVPHFAQWPRERLSRFPDGELANLIAAQSVRKVHRSGLMAREAQIVFGAGDKEGVRRRHTGQPDKVHVRSIYHVEGTRFENQFVEPSHIVQAGRGDIDHRGDGATQVELRVQLDARLGGAEVGPAKQGQRQIDGGRIQSINRVFQFDPQVLVGIESASLGHQPQGQIAPESPVAPLVGFGQRCASNGLGESQVVERLGLCVQAGFDVAQAFAPGQLGKDHADELLSAAKMADAIFGVVAKGQSLERLPMDQVEDLGKHKSSGVHGHKACPDATRSSNASHLFSCSSACL